MGEHLRPKRLIASLLVLSLVAAIGGAGSLLTWPGTEEAPAAGGLAQRLRQAGLATRFTRTSGRHVDFYHRSDADLTEFIRIVDGFLDFVDSEFLPGQAKRRFTVFVSGTREEHARNAGILFDDRRPAHFGTWYKERGVLATHPDAGPGTVTSLLVFPLLAGYVGDAAPHWATAAIATFFEKVFAYPSASTDGLVFRVGYHSPWRVAEFGRCLHALDLERIVADPDYASGASHYRLLGMFLWDHGLLDDLVRRLRDESPGDGAALVASLFGRPIADVSASWRAWVARVAEDRNRIDAVPVSRIYASEDEFHAAMAAAEEAAKDPPRPPTARDRCVLRRR